MVGVIVMSSKPGDCHLNSETSVDVIALQDMHNEFRQQIDSGLGKLASSQGVGGLPAGPAAGAIASRDGQVQADSNSEASLIQQQQQSANQAEIEARLASNGGG
jgi:aryl-alcohol dehydrogenase-like predicted oxidoreductase